MKLMIEKHDGMEGVVILHPPHNDKWGVQYHDGTGDCGDKWFKITSVHGPTFLDCDSLTQALDMAQNYYEGMIE